MTGTGYRQKFCEPLHHSQQYRFDYFFQVGFAPYNFLSLNKKFTIDEKFLKEGVGENFFQRVFSPKLL
jgi:hypothetical protein